MARAEIWEGCCVIRFSDQGDGIRSDWIDKIFDEFAIRSIMHHQKGRGLSLAISKYIMELHDGTIHAESTPGNGATFILRVRAIITSHFWRSDSG